MEVNRIYNIRKSNLDRMNNKNAGKLKEDFSTNYRSKQISLGKNVSQIVFGTELEDRKRSQRGSSMLPTSPQIIEKEKIESRRSSQVNSHQRKTGSMG